MSEQFDSVKFDPAKVPAGWIPPAGDLPGEGRPVRIRSFKSRWWVLGILTLAVAARIVHRIF